MSGNNISQNQAYFLQYSCTPTQGHDDMLHNITSPEKPARPYLNPQYFSASQLFTSSNGDDLGRVGANRRPASVHINPKFQNTTMTSTSAASASTGHQSSNSSGKVVINPNFKQRNRNVSSSNEVPSTSLANNVHVNPRFQMTPKKDGGTLENPSLIPCTTNSVHVNPKFANRPLPSLPGGPIYANLNPDIDQRKQSEFIQSIQQTVAMRHPPVEKTGQRRTAPAKPVRNSMIITGRHSSARATPHQQRYSMIAEHLVVNHLATSSVSASAARTVPSSTTTTSYVRGDVSVATPSARPPITAVDTVPPTLRPCDPLPASQHTAATPLTSKADEKENHPSSSKRSFLFTPLRKTPFKKIGDRKLVRVKKKSISPGTPKPSFKRIGNKKLIRIRDSMVSRESSTSSPLKVYEIKTKTKLVKSVKNTPANAARYRFSFITPLSVRKTRRGSAGGSAGKSSSHLTKSAPAKKSRTFSSRFRLDRRDKTLFEGKEPGGSAGKRNRSQSRLRTISGGSYRVSSTKLQKISTAPSKTASTFGSRRHFSVYRPKASAINPSIAANKVITVQGVKFAVTENGRRLKRVASAASTPSAKDQASERRDALASEMRYSASQSSPDVPGCSDSGGRATLNPRTPLSATKMTPSSASDTPVSSRHDSPIYSEVAERTPSVTTSKSTVQGTGPTKAIASPIVGTRASSGHASSKKIYLGGEEFDEIEPGVFTRSRHSLTRQSITQAKNRSINIILRNQTRSKQYCMFFNKFGKCTKKEKGTCPYIHDPDKVAVCKRLLREGDCSRPGCLLSHKLAPEKMPACKYFLEGLCNKPECPYLHVKVSESAAICRDFLRGYCDNGADCSKRHVIACPEFHTTGKCSKEGKCHFPHVRSGKSAEPGPAGGSKPCKARPPPKPKRKSLGHNTEHNLKKSRVTKGSTGEDDLLASTEAPPSKTGSRYFHSAEAKQDLESKSESVADSSKTVVSERDRESIGDDNKPRAKLQMDKSGIYARIAGDDSSDEDELAAQSGAADSLPSSDPKPTAGQPSTSRQPIDFKELGDFISLAGYSSGEEHGHDRLI